MTDDDDYRRISKWLDKDINSDRIEIEHQGRNFDQLTRKEKKEVISDMLFKGFYPSASEKLSKGVDYVRGNNEEFKETQIRTKKGLRTVIRERNGRIFRWLK